LICEIQSDEFLILPVERTRRDRRLESIITKSEPEKLCAKTIGGLHDAALREFTRHIKTPTNVLDLGAGTGAWAAKLVALGHNVTCVDQCPADFALESARCEYADLNEDFSSIVKDRYSAITSIEVIEHLENPRHFLRECKNLMRDNAILLLTTPNIENVAGRIRFMFKGNFRMFDRDEKLNDPTHISPIQTYMFEKMARDIGLRILFHGTGDPNREISTRLSSLICFLTAPFLSDVKAGDNHIFVLAKI
jgi:2-polyprenyl-3-methyl-5-hydroxy-6-metoxy-1,4-benzoquinol methylase